MRLRAAASATRTSTRSTARPRRAARPCWATRAPGVVEAVGAGVASPPGAPRGAVVAAVLRRVRGVPARAAAPLHDGVAARWPPAGCSTARRDCSRDGEPVFHYSFLSTFAERTVVPARCCIPIPDDVPFDVAALVGCAITTGTGAVWRTAGVRPGDRVAVFGCGGVGLSAVLGAPPPGRDPIVAVDVSVGASSRPRCARRDHAVEWAGGPEETAERVSARSGGGVDYAIEATGRTEAARAAFLSTRARGAAVLIGIPAADAEVSLPARSIPRMERRVLGSVYGSARPERDFPALLALYRRGRLPLDRLVAARLPLDAVEDAFGLMRGGSPGRVVLELDGAAA